MKANTPTDTKEISFRTSEIQGLIVYKSYSNRILLRQTTTDLPILPCLNLRVQNIMGINLTPSIEYFLRYVWNESELMYGFFLLLFDFNGNRQTR